MHQAALRLSFVTAAVAVVTVLAAGSADASPGHAPASRDASWHDDDAARTPYLNVRVSARSAYYQQDRAPRVERYPHDDAHPDHQHSFDDDRRRPAYDRRGPDFDDHRRPAYDRRQPAFDDRRQPVFAPRHRRFYDAHLPAPDWETRILERRFDLDRDGDLDVGERADLAAELRRMKRDGDSRFTDVDRATALIHAHDRNRSGDLELPELRAMLADTSLVQVFASFDRNADTMLSRVELDAAPMLANLRRADLDRSAYLSWRELDTYLSRGGSRR